MARIRSIKHGFFTNEQLADCSAEARLCFAGLWVLADREGRLEDRPRRIKAELFPYDSWDIGALLSELERVGVIERYEVEGGHYIQVPNFAKHQHPHPKEPASLIPPNPSNQLQVTEEKQEKPRQEHHKVEIEDDLSEKENGKKLPSTAGNGKQVTSRVGVVCGVLSMGNGSGSGDGSGARAPTSPEKPPDSEINPLVRQMAETCKMNLFALSEGEVRKLDSAMAQLRELLKQPDEVIAARMQRFGEFFATLQFKNPTPYPSQVPREWLKYEAWLVTKRRKSGPAAVDAELASSINRLKNKQVKKAS